MARYRVTDAYTRKIVYACFLISGAAGLIYEVVWARQLTLFLGITTYAHTAVITAYMVGLAAGSLVFGRLADRQQDHLRLYAWLEAGIGLYAAITPWLMDGIQSLYTSAAGGLGITGMPSHLIRFSLALLALLIPTFMMGGTLPLLVRGLTGNLPELAGVTGRLYGINTLGATLGTFAAGYLLLPSLGVRGTLFLAVLMNLAVAAAVLVVRRRLPAEERPAKTRPARRSPPARPRHRDGDALSSRAAGALLLGFALSGFAALVYELAWIRALTLVIGSSVYAFSTTLATYLAGLGLGSLLYARFLAQNRRTGQPSPPAQRLAQGAGLEVAIGLTALVGLPLIGLLPGLFLTGYQAMHQSFPLFQAFIFGLCFLLMFVPTLLLGALFPLVTALWTRDTEAMGRGVGMAYAANTAGTVLGSLLGGLLLLPTLGVHNSVVLAAGVQVVVGAGFWLLRPAKGRAASRYAPALAALLAFGLAAWLVPPWDRALMTSGPFVNPERLLERDPGQSLRDRARERELLYYAEGLDGVVSVIDTGTERLLVINGKTDASSYGDLPTQVLLGQLPMLLHPDPQRVLVIGLGSGITLGSVATHPEARQIDVLEISPEVVEASAFFAPEHGSVLSDPRVDLIVADARNFVLAHPEPYDVIISEPSNPWISGVSNLFTQEFFALARSRLAPGGLMTQWFHLYSMSTADLKTVLETYQRVFAHVTVWMPMPGDLVLIGSEEPHALDYVRLRAILGQEATRDDLARIELDSPVGIVTRFLFAVEQLASYAAGAPLNTDDRPRIEFSAPRSLYATTSFDNLLSIVDHLQGAQLAIPIVDTARATADGLEAWAMGLDVTTERPLADGDWRSFWMIQRQVKLATEGVDPTVNTLHQRTLVWNENGDETQVLALQMPHEPTLGEQRALIESLLTGRLAQGGELDLPGGRQGFWVLALGERVGEIVHGIAWSCPAGPEGFTQYTALHYQADPGEDGRGEALLDLASRFRCREQ